MAVLAETLFRRRRSSGWAGFLLAAFYLLALRSPSQAATPREYQVKAVFLFNFAQFVEWPPSAFGADAQGPVVIGVLGGDPFDGLLDEAVRGEKVNGRPLVIERYRRLQDVGNCHVLFISQTEAGRMQEIISSLKGRSVLTVGESEGFAAGGGMIRFMTDKGRIRLRINVEAARAANLKLSSKLLRPAEIVGSGTEARP